MYAFPRPEDVNSLEVISGSHPEINKKLQNIKGRNLWTLSVAIDINKPHFSYQFVLNHITRGYIRNGTDTTYSNGYTYDTNRIPWILAETFWHENDPGYDDFEEFCWFMFCYNKTNCVYDTITQYTKMNYFKISKYQREVIVSIEKRFINNFPDPRSCMGFLVFCCLNCLDSNPDSSCLSVVKPSTARGVLDACRYFKQADIPETVDLSLALLGLYSAVPNNQKSLIRFLSCVFHILRHSTLNRLFAYSQNLKIQVC